MTTRKVKSSSIPGLGPKFRQGLTLNLTIWIRYQTNI